MKVLVINCGSSSLKYQLIDVDNETVLAKGLVERIGIEGSVLTQKVEGTEKYVVKTPMNDHKTAIKLVLDALVNGDNKVLHDMKEIDAVGHRVVHAGEFYSSSVVIDGKVMDALKQCIKLAPLHNPPNIIGIEACMELMPSTPMVAVFDTAFHQSMPEVAYTYALPYEFYKKYRIRKYGFHGTSHNYVSKKAAEMLHKDLKDLKLITCHLGNGSSVTAIKDGKSVETSMGFTPLEGLAMGTRCGNIDPAIIPFIMKEMNLNIDQVNDVINKQSGVLGISGVSSDFRDIEGAAAEGNKQAKLALDVFNYRVKQHIGAYSAVLGGVDAIVFTAGLGENSAETREAICNGLEYLGVKIDKEKNNIRGKAAEISESDAKVKVLVIPTDEELMIARDTKELVNSIK